MHNANNCLTLLNLDQHRCNNDNGVFAKSKLEKLLDENELHFLKKPHLSGGKFEKTPYNLHMKNIFLCKMWLLFPFPKSKQTIMPLIYIHDRQSRGHNVIENNRF